MLNTDLMDNKTYTYYKWTLEVYEQQLLLLMLLVEVEVVVITIPLDN